MTPPPEKLEAAFAHLPEWASEALTVRSETPAGLAVTPEAAERVRDFARAARSDATRTAYRSDWAHFSAWCQAHRGSPLPAGAATVALYLGELADQGFKVATIERRLAAIAEAHKAAGMPSPRGDANLRAVVKGIRRKLGVAQKQARPLLPGDLRGIVAKLPTSSQGVRDRALLLLGFAGAFRRSELAGLNVGDLELGEDGLTVTLRRSKTDQEGAGRKVGVPFGSDKATCPVRAVRAWLASLGDGARGPLFRRVDRWGTVGKGRMTGQAVWRVVRRVAGSDFSGHSLRAGLATAAAKAGKSTLAIQKQTGHKSLAMVSRYVRDASLFEDNAAAGIGL
ncbi:MAG: site-specific integrase [Myxococcales bacterium]